MEPKDKILQSACMTEPEVDAFLRRTLREPRFLECADHIIECETCRNKLGRQQSLATARLQIEEDLSHFVEHVPEDDIQQYVSGRLGPARIHEINGHLTRCARCAKEVEDLRDFVASQRHVRAFYLRREFMAAAAILVVAVLVSLSLRRPRDLVVLNDASTRVSLDERGTLTGVGALTADQMKTVREALTQQRLAFPSTLRELNEKPGALMGAAEPAPFRLQAPAGTVVRDNRPTLSWTSDSASAGYRVTVQDKNTGEIITTPLLRTTSWTVSRILIRGHTYAWQVVSSRKDGNEVIAPRPPWPSAEFLILDESTNAKLLQLPFSHLARAVVYANAGLLDDADRELQALQEENPQSQLVQKLLSQLRQARMED
jgi:hypothetical protein